MKLSITFTPVFLLAVTYVLLFPLDMLPLLRGLKQQFRRYLIRRHGGQAFNEIAQIFRKEAVKKGHSEELIELTLQAHKHAIIEQHGTEYADQFLGKPEWYE